MDENEFNIDFEYEQLLNSELKKEPYILESVETERAAVVEAFYDHYVSITSAGGVDTFEEFLAESLVGQADKSRTENDDDFFQSSLETTLSELLQRDIEAYPVLHAGEMHVSGEGIFMYIPDTNEDTEVDILEDSATLTGNIKWYCAAPMIPYETFLKTQNGEGEAASVEGINSVEPIGLWLMMTNVTLKDGSGRSVTNYEEVMVPMTYPSLKFDKMVRYNQLVQKDTESGVETARIDIRGYFKSDFMLEIYNDMENDLNYNEYSDEELRKRRESYQDELGIYMTPVESEKELVLSVETATMLDGRQRELSDKAVRYLEPVLIKQGQSWRVVHAFELQSEDGFDIAHVLPENIYEINYLDTE